MSNVVTQVLDEVWDSVVGSAAEGLHWLKSVIFGEFADNRPLSAVVADMLVSFVPGVVIITSARDAVAVVLRLAQHPEKREEVLEWILLIACLITIALPLAAAAAGLAAAGVGAIVTGIAGSELAAALRGVILMLIKQTGKLVELVQFLNKFIKGDIIKFLRAIKFVHYEKALLQALKQITGKLIGIVQKVRTQLLEAKVLNVRLADHIDALQNIIKKLADWERKFYEVQQAGFKQIPRAITELQLRLDKLLAQTLPKETHTVSTGVRAEKPLASTPVKQEIQDAPGKVLRPQESKPTSTAGGTNGGGSQPPRKDKPSEPKKPEQQPNVKIEPAIDPVVGADRALVNGVEVKPGLYPSLYHGTTKERLGYATTASNKDVAADIYKNGLPGRGNNIDLAQHAEGAKDTAFRGTTFMKMNPDGQGGAVLWADEGGLVIQLKDVKGYDVNLATEGRIKKPDGTFGGNRVHGEQEIAVPGKVTPEQIETVWEVVTFPSGRLRTVAIPR
jgi:hypothetical protein